MESIARTIISTDIGDLEIIATDKAVCYIGLPDGNGRGMSFIHKYFPDVQITGGNAITAKATEELQAYFSGKLQKFTVPVEIKVNGFRKAALDAVAAIPFGETRTYGEIAKALGKPGAARAVGAANAANPVPIIVPCHRVVASNGLGGYGGGLPLKQRLLTQEKMNNTQ